MRLVAVALLSSALVLGQTSTKTLSSSGVFQDLAQITTAIRTIADLRDAAVDPGQGSVTLRGSQAQVELGEWLFGELTSSRDLRQHTASVTYQFSVDEAPYVRIFFFGSLATPEQLNEAQVLIRTISDIRRIFVYPARHALAVRSSEAQLALAAWLFDQIDKPVVPPVRHAASEPFLMPPQRDGENVVRLFWFAQAGSAAELLEASIAIRTGSEIRRLFQTHIPQLLALRGTRDQIELAESLFNEIDRPAGDPGSARPEFPVRGTDEVVRILYLPAVNTKDGFIDAGRKVATGTNVRNIFIYPRRHVLGLRGTVDAISRAVQLVE